MRRLDAILFLKGLKGVGKARIYKFYQEILKSDATMEKIIEYVRENESKLSADDIRNSAVKAADFIF